MEAGSYHNAQDWFRLMLDTGLAPTLRTLGFVGAGRRFRMPIDHYWADIGIIQSPSLAQSSVRFTLHLRVTTRDEWAEQLRVRPYSHPNRAVWEAPIGDLVLVGGHPIGELWWELEAGRPFEALSSEIITTLHTFGLPAISHHIQRSA